MLARRILLVALSSRGEDERVDAIDDAGDCVRGLGDWNEGILTGLLGDGHGDLLGDWNDAGDFGLSAR